MATTNRQIIMQYKIENNIPLETELYTYATWRSMGYIVRKGECSKHRVSLWKHKEKTVIKDGQEVTSGYCFGKTCYLFERGQVEKIK